jgi:uncharacterized membrane protein YoaK (UPF0700 family)
MADSDGIDTRTPAVATAIPLIGTLCATAGAIDVIAYLLFGNIFIANMTGNTVLFAASAIRRDWGEAALRIGVVIAFLFGIFIARALLRKWTSGHQRATRLTALGIEFALLVLLVSTSHPHTVHVELLVLLAFALGIQNDAFRNLGGIQLNTSFITGDLESLGAALANFEDPAKRQHARRRVSVFFTTWVGYGLGALVGALGASHFAHNALWIPAGLAIVAAVLVLQSPAQES